MPSLNPTRQNAILLIVLLFVQLLMMTSDVRQSDGTTLLQKGTLRLSQPVVLVSSLIGGGMEGLVRGARELTRARRENARLRREVQRLHAELDHVGEETLENARLRRLLDMRDYIAPRSVGASVVTASISSQEHVLVIDRGTDDGVLPDEPVIAWGGVVGRVVFADRHYAKVRLLSDPNSGVAGLVQRSRQGGVVLGRGRGLLEMAYVPSFADVIPGDRIVTSGIDGVFPKGIGIGTVRASEVAGVARSILVAPEVDFSRLEEVLVVRPAAGGVPPPRPTPEERP